MRKIKTVVLPVILASFTNVASAALLDFNNIDNLGVDLGGQMTWRSDGGGHLYANGANNDDYIFFTTDTYVNSFQMNASPWPSFSSSNESIGKIDIAGLNASDQTIWETTVDLTESTNWGKWLTVSVETADITQLTFFATGLLPHDNSFWPSIDNMVINEQVSQVPVPAAIWLFGSGLVGIFGISFKRRYRAQ